MKSIPIILSSKGFFNLASNVLPYSDLNIKNINLRTDINLIKQFNFYRNLIAKDCILRIEYIPLNILKEKNVIIYTGYDGSEALGIFETDGDVYMRDF